MKEQTGNRVMLGAFVLVAITCLILGLYYIGSKKNIFHSTINVSANFNNADGLMNGNNVCFNGINVGMVTKVSAISDSAVKVEFTIDKGETKFIGKSAIVSIGTDGLLGNKQINISPGLPGFTSVEEGNVLTAINPIKMDNTLHTLTLTNENLKIISDNLKEVSEKINNSHSLWHLIADSTLAENVRGALVKFKLTGDYSAMITGDLSKIVSNVRQGKGTLGTLLTDSLFSDGLKRTIINIESISDTMALITGNFKTMAEDLKNGKGALGILLNDTAFENDLSQSMRNIKSATNNVNQETEALKYTWPFKKYFKQH